MIDCLLNNWLLLNSFECVSQNKFINKSSTLLVKTGISELWLNKQEKVYFWYKSINTGAVLSKIEDVSYFFCFTESKSLYISRYVALEPFSDCVCNKPHQFLNNRLKMLRSKIPYEEPVIFMPNDCDALYFLVSKFKNSMLDWFESTTPLSFEGRLVERNIKDYLKLLDFCKLLFDSSEVEPYVLNKNKSTNINVKALSEYCKNIDKDLLSKLYPI